MKNSRADSGPGMRAFSASSQALSSAEMLSVTIASSRPGTTWAAAPAVRPLKIPKNASGLRIDP